MSNDDFESSTGSASTTEEYKYAQVTVPSFSFDTTSLMTDATTGNITTTTSTNADANPSGNSFLRLGSFPYSVTSSNGATSYPDAPDGFDSSLTLAKIVGDAAGIESVAANDASTTTDDNYFKSDPFKGDSLLGFADDTRIRDDAEKTVLYVDGVAKENSTANRKSESKRLLTKGGWWDHSDGNRVSTTAGDKIEIIQGNYKMVVLGRRSPALVGDADAGDKKVTDVSGGYEHSKRYEYLSSEKVWATWEKSSRANATKVTEGIEVSYFKGSLRKTVVGEHPDGTEEKPDVETTSHVKKSKTETHADSIETKTHAKTIYTQTGFFDDWVQNSFALTCAYAMEDIRFGGGMVDARVFGDHVTLRSAALLQSANVALHFTNATITKALWKIDIAPIQWETKIGVDGKFSSKRVKVAAAVVDLNAKKEELNAALTRITNLETALVDTRTRITRTTTALSSTRVDIENAGLHVSTVRYFV